MNSISARLFSGLLARFRAFSLAHTLFFLAAFTLASCDSATMAKFSKSLDAMTSGANLIVNGTFEQPVVPNANYKIFNTGTSFPGWQVVGASGGVAVISGQYKSSGTQFTAQSGNQWLDITGLSNSATGIQQTVKTEVGAEYELSFYVGNVAVAGFGTTSSIEVLLDGKSMGAFKNDAKSSGSQVWRQVLIPVTASKSSLTITFMNHDSSNDNSNGLDSVSFRKKPEPEPTTTPAS